MNHVYVINDSRSNLVAGTKIYRSLGDANIGRRSLLDILLQKTIFANKTNKVSAVFWQSSQAGYHPLRIISDIQAFVAYTREDSNSYYNQYNMKITAKHVRAYNTIIENLRNEYSIKAIKLK